jgi:hypothetical protein
MSKFYKTIVTIEILSEEPIGNPDLEEIQYQTTEGHWSGVCDISSVQELTAEEMSKALIAQGSDPQFFGI